MFGGIFDFDMDGKIDEVELADIAFSGDIKDLKETANTYVVFNCGSSSVNV
jgi:hypothetical protein